MESAICRVFIFGLAIRTERKTGHAGIGPVVRQLRYQGVARSTLGAVDERITITSVPGIVQFPQAIRAGVIVGRHVNAGFGIRAAGLHFKSGERLQGCPGGLARYRSGQGRCLLLQGAAERIQRGGIRLGMNDDLAEPVLDPAAHTQSLSKAINERPEADTLDPAGKDQAARFGRGSGWMRLGAAQ